VGFWLAYNGFIPLCGGKLPARCTSVLILSSCVLGPYLWDY